jgi:hypothetical protein
MILDDEKAIHAQRWGYVGWALIIAAFVAGLAGAFASWTVCVNGALRSVAFASPPVIGLAVLDHGHVVVLRGPWRPIRSPGACRRVTRFLRWKRLACPYNEG